MTHPHVVAMRQRIAHIRRLVAVCAVVAFLALFSTIYVQMATGHDPVLATTTPSSSTASTSGSTATGSSQRDSEPSAVTTKQS